MLKANQTYYSQLLQHLHKHRTLVRSRLWIAIILLSIDRTLRTPRIGTNYGKQLLRHKIEIMLNRTIASSFLNFNISTILKCSFKRFLVNSGIVFLWVKYVYNIHGYMYVERLVLFKYFSFLNEPLYFCVSCIIRIAPRASISDVIWVLYRTARGRKPCHTQSLFLLPAFQQSWTKQKKNNLVRSVDSWLQVFPLHLEGKQAVQR